MRTYSELVKIQGFYDRYLYLKLDGVVGAETFGYDRYINQALYRSPEWKKARREVILRDNGCDLGVEGRELYSRIYIHHINPITKQQLLDRDPIIFDMENLITVSFNTHQAIHYGDESLIAEPVIRKPNDQIPWRK